MTALGPLVLVGDDPAAPPILPPAGIDPWLTDAWGFGAAQGRTRPEAMIAGALELDPAGGRARKHAPLA
ncbi:MAG: hypothetical protein ACK5JR_12540 [Tropicimonas sp.]|uniref:hypothetical protein n=1 Tax=Tropicimonas sp. TaxID=2067044 RepID=UPI003A8378A6